MGGGWREGERDDDLIDLRAHHPPPFKQYNSQPLQSEKERKKEGKHRKRKEKI